MKKVILALIVLASTVAYSDYNILKDGPFPRIMGIWTADNNPQLMVSFQAGRPVSGKQHYSVMLTDAHGRPVAVGDTITSVDTSSLNVSLYYKDGHTGTLQARAFTTEGKNVNVPVLHLRVLVTEDTNQATSDLVFSHLP